MRNVDEDLLVQSFYDSSGLSNSSILATSLFILFYAAEMSLNLHCFYIYIKNVHEIPAMYRIFVDEIYAETEMTSSKRTIFFT